MSLAGQNAVITGASSGIGRAIAVVLARAGVRVHLIGRDQTRLAALREELADCSSLSYVLDLTDDQALEAFCRSFCEEHRRLDMLIHSAGVVTLGSVATADIRTFDHHYQVNSRLPFLLT
jgi:NADP-dependent 3-hydroxy acid dehydrogenase YdfG